MPLDTTAITILIMIPMFPLFAYVVGLLLPASHIVSRSSVFKISSRKLWKILIDVNEYPQWQPKIEKVIVHGSSDDETVFIEYSTERRQTAIIHYERTQYQCLLRILEEKPVATQTKIPTFSGSWTFEIIQEKEHDDQVTLKITEQGVIKKPLVRVTHLLLFGFFNRIDRFMRDLVRKVEADNQQMLVDSVNVKDILPTSVKNYEIGELKFLVPKKSVTKESPETKLTTDRSLDNKSEEGDMLMASYSTLLTSNEDDLHSTTDQCQQLEPSDMLMTESKIIDKDWDLLCEIYDHIPN